MAITGMINYPTLKTLRLQLLVLVTKYSQFNFDQIKVKFEGEDITSLRMSNEPDIVLDVDGVSSMLRSMKIFSGLNPDSYAEIRTKDSDWKKVISVREITDPTDHYIRYLAIT